MTYIYLITNLITTQSYISYHTHNSLFNKYIGKNKQLLMDVKLLGNISFSKTILCTIKNKKELNVLIPYYINLYNTYNEGYNVTMTATIGKQKKHYKPNMKQPKQISQPNINIDNMIGKNLIFNIPHK